MSEFDRALDKMREVLVKASLMILRWRARREREERERMYAEWRDYGGEA